MGWGNCGTDSQGRPIGYNHNAICDHPGCNEQIDRGLAFACGDMHGEDEVSCEKYFCGDHKQNFVKTTYDDRIVSVCDECAKQLLDTKEWYMDEEEGLIIKKEETI